MEELRVLFKVSIVMEAVKVLFEVTLLWKQIEFYLR